MYRTKDEFTSLALLSNYHYIDRTQWDGSHKKYSYLLSQNDSVNDLVFVCLSCRGISLVLL